MPNAWFAGARPRTLPAAVVPVLVGTASVRGVGEIVWWRAAAAMAVALALQVGTNYANDYSDGIRGTDSDERRVGPVRLVGSGLKSPSAVKRAALASFGVAAVVGFTLVLAVGPELLVVGVACVLAAWYYTGGRRPYGYLGLGELFVFVFFGLVAVCGTVYVQLGRVTVATVLTGIGIGALTCAILVANNLRDIIGDAAVGKRTLATRLGDRRTRVFYLLLVALGALMIIGVAAITSAWALLGLVGLIMILPAARTVLAGGRGPELIGVLKTTGLAELVSAVGFAAGLIIAR